MCDGKHHWVQVLIMHVSAVEEDGKQGGMIITCEIFKTLEIISRVTESCTIICSKEEILQEGKGAKKICAYSLYHYIVYGG